MGSPRMVARFLEPATAVHRSGHTVAVWRARWRIWGESAAKVLPKGQERSKCAAKLPSWAAFAALCRDYACHCATTCPLLWTAVAWHTTVTAVPGAVIAAPKGTP